MVFDSAELNREVSGRFEDLDGCVEGQGLLAASLGQSKSPPICGSKVPGRGRALPDHKVASRQQGGLSWRAGRCLLAEHMCEDVAIHL